MQHYAARSAAGADTVHMLLDAGADPGTVDADGHTPLAIAASADVAGLLQAAMLVDESGESRTKEEAQGVRLRGFVANRALLSKISMIVCRVRPCWWTSPARAAAYRTHRLRRSAIIACFEP
jgi:hypothetical protein